MSLSFTSVAKSTIKCSGKNTLRMIFSDILAKILKSLVNNTTPLKIFQFEPSPDWFQICAWCHLSSYSTLDVNYMSKVLNKVDYGLFRHCNIRLEPVPADIGQEAGSTLDTSPTYRRANIQKLKFRISNPLDCGR